MAQQVNNETTSLIGQALYERGFDPVYRWLHQMGHGVSLTYHERVAWITLNSSKFEVPILHAELAMLTALEVMESMALAMPTFNTADVCPMKLSWIAPASNLTLAEYHRLDPDARAGAELILIPSGQNPNVVRAYFKYSTPSCLPPPNEWAGFLETTDPEELVKFLISRTEFVNTKGLRWRS